MAGLLLCACSTAPLTVLQDHQVLVRTALNRYPVRVDAVDSRGNLQTPVFVEPGVHQVTIAAPPPDGFPNWVEKTYTLNLAPCTRYYIAADRANRLKRDWTLVVEDQEPVGACDPQLEWKKAGQPDNGPARAPGASVIISG
jgi:hypothetical protein